MKKRTFLLSSALLTLSLFSGSSFAADSLIGNWASNKIKLHLKASKNYNYSVKILGVNKNFSGKWSTSGNVLTLNYTLLGEHKKTATYSFDKGDLLLKQGGKTSRLKRK